MSYIRGPNYIWRDDERVHIWVADGHDEWQESGWAEEFQRQVPQPQPEYGAPSGVGLRQDVADLYVVMRFAELVQEKRAGEIIEHAVKTYAGNGGCLALVQLAPVLLRSVDESSPHEGGH